MLHVIKFSNGLYLGKVDHRHWKDRDSKPLTSDINEAYIDHDINYLIHTFEMWNNTDIYRTTLERGGGSYKPVEVKIVEATEVSHESG